MSFWKEKKNPRLRDCHIKISPKCKGIFKTKFKVSGKRTACKNCKEYLKKIGTNVWRYEQMEKAKENFEWLNKNEIRAKINKEIDIKNEKQEIIGTKKEEHVQMTTFEEMEVGMENIEEMIAKNEKQIKIFKNQIERLGKIPIKSNEMIRLEDNLIKLSKIKKQEELQGKIDPLESQNKESVKVLLKRKEFLKQRPK